VYRYLEAKTADYTDTVFSVPSAIILPQSGHKTQVIHPLDDGSVSVVGISDNSFFDVPLQWNHISQANHTILIDFWHNPLKGDGYRRTFYWAHPIDDKIYTVRFMSDLTTPYNPGNYLSVNQVLLRVEGTKPL